MADNAENLTQEQINQYTSVIKDIKKTSLATEFYNADIKQWREAVKRDDGKENDYENARKEYEHLRDELKKELLDKVKDIPGACQFIESGGIQIPEMYDYVEKSLIDSLSRFNSDFVDGYKVNYQYRKTNRDETGRRDTGTPDPKPVVSADLQAYAKDFEAMYALLEKENPTDEDVKALLSNNAFRTRNLHKKDGDEWGRILFDLPEDDKGRQITEENITPEDFKFIHRAVKNNISHKISYPIHYIKPLPDGRYAEFLEDLSHLKKFIETHWDKKGENIGWSISRDVNYYAFDRFYRGERFYKDLYTKEQFAELILSEKFFITDEEKEIVRRFFNNYENYKDIPDEDKEKIKKADKEKIKEIFREKNKLGLLKRERFDNIGIVARTLQKAGANESLKHFLNDQNTPDGETAVTYLTRHILAAQSKLDRDQWRRDKGETPNLSDEDRKQMEEGMIAAKESLKTLLTLKDENGNYYVDLTKTNSQGMTAQEMMARYDAAVSKFNEKNGASLEAASRSIGELFNTQQPPHDNERETNVGNTENTPPQATNPPQKVVDLVPHEDKKDKDRGKRGDWKNAFGKISKKPVCEWFYEDCFMAGLEWLTDKLLGWLNNAAKNYAERMKRSANNLDQVAKKRAEGDRFREVIEHLRDNQNNIDAVARQFVGTRDARRTYMEGVNNAIINNIIKPTPGTPENWQPLDINNPADRTMIDRMKKLYAENPTEFAKHINKLNNPDQLNKVLDYQEKTHTCAYIMALVDLKKECLSTNNPEIANLEEEKNKQKFEKKVLHYMEVLNTGLAGAKILEERGIDENAGRNFIENMMEKAMKANEDLDKDIAAGHFMADTTKSLKDRQLTFGQQSYEDFVKLANDTLDSASVFQFEQEISNKKNPDKTKMKKVDLREGARQQIEEITNSSLDNNLNATRADYAGIMGQLDENRNRDKNVKAFINKLLGKDNGKSNAYYQSMTKPNEGRS